MIFWFMNFRGPNIFHNLIIIGIKRCMSQQRWKHVYLTVTFVPILKGCILQSNIVNISKANWEISDNQHYDIF
jgi:hypothetical protein